MNLLKHETGVVPIQCPFCGRSALEVLSFSSNGWPKFYVHCMTCLAQGPAAPHKKAAVELWNDAEGDEDADYE